MHSKNIRILFDIGLPFDSAHIPVYHSSKQLNSYKNTW